MLKSKIVIIPIVVVLFGLNNVIDNFQITFFNSKNGNGVEVKVLSYNVQNFNELKISNGGVSTKKRILNFLLEQDDDIVCLQEYHSTSNNLYEPLKEIRDTLEAQSYFYESYFNPSYNQLSGLVTFSKYKAVNKGKLKFKGTRLFGIYTDVIIRADTVRIYNIHLASIKLQPEDLDFVVNPEVENSESFRNKTYDIYSKLMLAYELRERQLDVLISEIESCNYPIILCGDFNDTPSSWVYNQLANYLSDTFVSKGNGISVTYAGPLPLLRIDYILHSNSFKTGEYTKHNFRSSDHFPISAIIYCK